MKKCVGTLLQQPLLKKEGGALMLVDGTFQQKSCQEGNIIALPLEEAFSSYGSLLQCVEKTEAKNGLFLYVPPKVCLEEPLEIEHLVTHNGQFFPKIFVFAGNESRFSILLKASFPQHGSFLYHSSCELHLGDASHVSLSEDFSALSKQNKGAFFDTIHVRQQAGSHFSFFGLSCATGEFRSRLHIELAGAGAEAALKGFFAASRHGKSYLETEVVHSAPSTKSSQYFKEIVSDRALHSFLGKIRITKEGANSEASQINRSLILHDGARAIAKPILEILSDAKASHGATTNYLYGEELFYLMCRGLSEKEAQRLVIQGFCEEMFQGEERKELKKSLFSCFFKPLMANVRNKRLKR